MDVKISIPDDKIRGLLCCALEGGSNYWYQIVGEELRDGLTHKDFQEGGSQTGETYWHPSQLIPFVEGCSVVFSTGDDPDSRYKLDKAAIEKGLALMQQKYTRHWGDFMAENDDATTGDVFLQLCLFGSVVYG